MFYALCRARPGETGFCVTVTCASSKPKLSTRHWLGRAPGQHSTPSPSAVACRSSSVRALEIFANGWSAASTTEFEFARLVRAPALDAGSSLDWIMPSCLGASSERGATRRAKSSGRRPSPRAAAAAWKLRNEVIARSPGHKGRSSRSQIVTRKRGQNAPLLVAKSKSLRRKNRRNSRGRGPIPVDKKQRRPSAIGSTIVSHEQFQFRHAHFGCRPLGQGDYCDHP